jgi:hypothetical protein
MSRWPLFVVTLVALTSSPGLADPVKGSPIDIFGGPKSDDAASASIEMQSYCRAEVDIIVTQTYAATLFIEGSSFSAPTEAQWFPEPFPGQTVEPNGAAKGVNISASPPTTGPWARRLHYDFAVLHTKLRFRTSVHSGQGGGTMQALLTPLPC